MSTFNEIRKEKIDMAYIIFGLGADVNQIGRAYLRNEPKGVRRNITQIIHKLEKIRKRI
jgi:heptaprenylglyceryl phosphate synthase